MTTTYAANNRLSGLEYRFSPDRLAELNRAPVPLLLARITTGCPSYGKTAADIDSVDTLITEIRGHCAGDTDFIRQSMPLQEIVFRTLLLDADSTMTLGQLHQELTERWFVCHPTNYCYPLRPGPNPRQRRILRFRGHPR